MRESIPLTEAELSILKRVERLPFGRLQWRLLWMGGSKSLEQITAEGLGRTHT